MNDCFAYNPAKNGCRALNVKKCYRDGCTWYKGKEQLRAERKRSVDRLKSLDPGLQQHMVAKYGEGLMDPWSS